MKAAVPFLVPLLATLAHCAASPPATEGAKSAEPAVAATPAKPGSAAAGASSPDESFRALERRYVVEFLRRNPTVNTYLGGAGLDPSLAEADGRLRDHGARALQEEDQWLASMEKELEASSQLQSPALQIDRDVALAQVRFLVHQHQVRRYQEQSIDTYVDEPFRAVDFYLQGMTSTGPKSTGTPDEWRRLIARLRSVGPYFKTAQANLDLGVASGRTADARVLAVNGLASSEANAEYFERQLPALASTQIAGQGQERDQLLAEVREGSRAAAAAYRDFHRYLAATFFDDPKKGAKGIKARFAGDKFAMGAVEYDWALKNNLRLNTNAARLFDESWPILLATREKIVKLAREIGGRRGLALPKDDDTAVRTVFDHLSKETITSNEAMLKGYRETCFRMIDGARKNGLFDVPADYRIDIMETPEPLRGTITGAAYYPAPPFKKTGTGRFYVSPIEPGSKGPNVHQLADLCAHEAFPGHDWHFKSVAANKAEVGLVRWLTPGAVEDSSSMWLDSLAAEGWGLYSEYLVAEPTADSPHGLFTPEEHLYALRAGYYRDLRVRVDTGMHIGRLSFDAVVDLLSSVPDFLPGSCRDAKARTNADKRSSCTRAEHGALRYARDPTQAITYRVGKDIILAMRQEAGVKTPADLHRFHAAFMRQGFVPSTFFREELLREVRQAR
ncbi:DUF885 domain-containing protein [Pendulispora albinea]|uniref:DUF885 domain-containing protein n=1 Tax=Pendulispora albinea TaxID=2741071 RepID=A0ABZ2M5D2_9BACT